MARIFHIVVEGNKAVPVEGVACRMYVGGRQLDCFIHRDVAGHPHLSEKRTGMRIGSLGAIKFQFARSYHEVSDRDAAKRLIADLEARVGADRIWERINAAPTLQVQS